MDKDELYAFLRLLKERNNSFSELKKMQSDISDNISTAKQGQMNQLGSNADRLFDELGNQKKLLSPFLIKWGNLSKETRESILEGEIGKLIDEIEKNALEISKFHQDKYEMKPLESHNAPSADDRLSERINLSR